MDKAKAKILMFLILSLGVQIINLVGSGYLKSVYSTLDDLHPATKGEPSHMEENEGNHNYVVAASSLSILIYLYLLGAKIKDTTLSKTLDWFLYILVNSFQFGIAVTYSIFVTNNLVRFETAMMNYYGLLTVIPTIPKGTIVPDPTPYSKTILIKQTCFLCVLCASQLLF
jgi:hypothetical protein